LTLIGGDSVVLHHQEGESLTAEILQNGTEESEVVTGFRAQLSLVCHRHQIVVDHQWLAHRTPGHHVHYDREELVP
jgi:hypothetical protein